jgi:hypothetical protein
MMFPNFVIDFCRGFCSRPCSLLAKPSCIETSWQNRPMRNCYGFCHDKIHPMLNNCVFIRDPSLTIFFNNLAWTHPIRYVSRLCFFWRPVSSHYELSHILSWSMFNKKNPTSTPRPQLVSSSFFQQLHMDPLDLPMPRCQSVWYQITKSKHCLCVESNTRPLLRFVEYKPLDQLTCM